MECLTQVAGKERLSEAVDKLTDENQRCFLGVVEALTFAQNEQNKTRTEKRKELPAYPI